MHWYGYMLTENWVVSCHFKIALVRFEKISFSKSKNWYLHIMYVTTPKSKCYVSTNSWIFQMKSSQTMFTDEHGLFWQPPAPKKATHQHYVVHSKSEMKQHYDTSWTLLPMILYTPLNERSAYKLCRTWHSIWSHCHSVV